MRREEVLCCVASTGYHVQNKRSMINVLPTQVRTRNEIQRELWEDLQILANSRPWCPEPVVPVRCMQYVHTLTMLEDECMKREEKLQRRKLRTSGDQAAASREALG